MKRGVLKSFGCSGIIAVIVLIMCGLTSPAYSQSKDMVLLLEQTPVKGGEITPVAGVHYFKPESEVVLTAVPKAGYKFTHWLGDVSDPTAASTVVYLNEPKVIIAVFEKAEQGISGDGEGFLAGGGGGGGGGLVPTALDLSRPGGFGGGGGVKSQKPVFYVKGKKPMPEVPEPATGLLMMLGGLLAFKRHGPKRIAG